MNSLVYLLAMTTLATAVAAAADPRPVSEFGFRYHVETWVGGPAADLADQLGMPTRIARAGRGRVYVYEQVAGDRRFYASVDAGTGTPTPRAAACAVYFSVQHDVVAGVSFQGKQCTYAEPPTFDLGAVIDPAAADLELTSVRWPSIAAKFGLKAGDHLTAVDGAPLASLYDLRRALADAYAGDRRGLRLAYERDGKPHSVRLTLDQRYDSAWFYLFH